MAFKTAVIDISLLKENPDNPRTITDAKFQQLVQSVKNFPQMLEARPIAFKKGYVVLGGNMRLRACIAAGIKKVPAIDCSEMTEDQQREFVIKDNVGFGEWDWQTIQADWPEAEEWGLEVPGFAISPDDLGDDFTLKNGDKEPFQQMTFTLADAQAEIIKSAIKDVKVQPGTEYGNENGNGNKLHQIILEWVEQKKLL